jgi:DNA-binding transcriptional LysR family regulator
MDRLEEWRVYVAVAGRRSFAGAARALGRSPQAVTRAVAALEARLQTRLLHRTTRSVSLTGDGERYLERGRRALAEFDALEYAAESDAPLTGRLAVTAPVLFGQLHVAPLVCAFLERHPRLDARLLLLDRVVSLADEGVDLALRIGALPDSALRTRPLGQVRALTCASPGYLARAGVPRTPAALAAHACIAFSGTTPVEDHWRFAGPNGRDVRVTVRPRLAVNSGQAAIDAALAGLGVVRVLSYQVQALLAKRRLRVLLASFEPAPLPLQLVSLPGVPTRAAAAFAELAAAGLRRRLGA